MQLWIEMGSSYKIECSLQNLCLIKIQDLDLSSSSETPLKSVVWIQILVEADL